jgi:hypothetical protein
MHQRLALALGAIAALSGAPAAAAEGEPIRLEYYASDGCPDRAAFEALAHTRTARVHFVTAGQARTFVVGIDAGSPAKGRLVVLRGESVEGTREIGAPTCEQAAEAIALMVALAVDPSALSSPAVATGAAPQADAPQPAATESTPVAAPDLPPAPAPTTPTPLPPSPPAPDVAPAAPSRTASGERERLGQNPAPPPPPRRLYLGADFVVAGNVSPNTILGLSPYVGWRGRRTGWLEPGVRLGFLHGSGGSITTSVGTASFSWTVGRADGCLLSWADGPVELHGCARVEAGALEGQGSAVPGARSDTRGWLAAGAVVRLEWTVVASLFLDAEVAAMVHVTNDRFYFAPDSTIYTVPIVGLDAAGGVGVHFL